MTDKHIQNTQAVYEQYLILRIQTGETAALNDLVERWQGKFVRVAWIRCRDQQLAMDAVQEAWIAIVKSLPGLRDPARFRPWAFRIVNNKCLDLIRKRQSVDAPLDSLEPDSEDVGQRQMSETNDISRLENQEIVTRTLSRLPEASRVVLALHYLEDMGIEEISQALGLPAGTVKSRLHNGREAFRVHFSDMKNR